MTHDVTLRRMRTADLTEALWLTQAESWSHRLEDWAFHFRLGRGWVACGDDTRVVGTALWWPYGRRLATIGLIVVDRAYQGQGIGRRLMGAVMSDAGSRSLHLVATRAGSRLYQQCGFEHRGEICQHQGVATAAPLPPGAGTARLRRVTSADLPAISQWDAAAFGAERAHVITAVLDDGEGFLAERDGRLAGYALARSGGRGTIIGPVAANDETLAIELIAHRLRRVTGFARLDVPADATLLRAWLESAGLPRVDQAPVMTRGDAPQRGTARVYGLTSQALT